MRVTNLSEIAWNCSTSDPEFVRVTSDGLIHLRKILFYLDIPSELQKVLGRILLFFLNTFISLQWFLNSVNVISDILFSLLKIFAILFIFFFAFIITRKIFKIEGIVIMPFEVPTGKDTGNYSGKAISDLLTSELQRILRIHSLEFEGISIRSENLSIPRIVPRGETLEYSIAEIGTLEAGSTSISLGKIIITFKRLCPGSGPVPILTGSLQIYGPVIIITACLEEREVRTWEVRRKITGSMPTKEEQIPRMIRDLSFKIAHDLANRDNQI